LVTERTPEKIEIALMKLLPQKYWLLFSHWLVWHGRRRCFARKPDCADCEVLKWCPRIGVKEGLTTKVQRHKE
jgi:endonuclease-3